MDPGVFELNDAPFLAGHSTKLQYLDNRSTDFTAGKDVRLYGMEIWLGDLCRDLAALRMAWHLRTHKRDFGAACGSALLLLGKDAFAYSYLIDLVLRGALGGGDFLFFVGVFGGFSTWMSGLVDGFSRLRLASLDLCDVRAFLEMPEHSPKESQAPLPSAFPCPIAFEGVSFSYPGGGEKALETVDLTVRAGEKIAIVGANGAGKTTFAKLNDAPFLAGHSTLQGTAGRQAGGLLLPAAAFPAQEKPADQHEQDADDHQHRHEQGVLVLAALAFPAAGDLGRLLNDAPFLAGHSTMGVRNNLSRYYAPPSISKIVENRFEHSYVLQRGNVRDRD